jgi:hypothetical protein
MSDEVVKTHKISESKGIEHLKTFGFNIGDTVYMDGRLEATIYSAYYFPYGLRVAVTITGASAADYLGVENYRNFSQICIPCGMSA